MPVNSYSFKINVPTSSIPIVTTVDRSNLTPPQLPNPSTAVDTSSFTPGTPSSSITVPARSMLVVIYPSVNHYRIIAKCNRNSSSTSYASRNEAFYYTTIEIGTSGDYNTAAFYGTDGVLSNMLLFSVSDFLDSDEYSTTSFISTKSLLIDLPE